MEWIVEQGSIEISSLQSRLPSYLVLAMFWALFLALYMFYNSCTFLTFAYVRYTSSSF